MSYNNEWIWSILNGLPQGSWERGEGGTSETQKLGQSGFDIWTSNSISSSFLCFCRRNLFLSNKTLCLLDGVRWGWNLKLACLRTLLQGFYQTFCWFWLELWLFSLYILLILNPTQILEYDIISCQNLDQVLYHQFNSCWFFLNWSKTSLTAHI